MKKRDYVVRKYYLERKKYGSPVVVVDGFEQEHDAFTKEKLNYKTPVMQTVKAGFH